MVAAYAVGNRKLDDVVARMRGALRVKAQRRALRGREVRRLHRLRQRKAHVVRALPVFVAAVELGALDAVPRLEDGVPVLDVLVCVCARLFLHAVEHERAAPVAVQVYVADARAAHALDILGNAVVVHGRIACVPALIEHHFIHDVRRSQTDLRARAGLVVQVDEHRPVRPARLQARRRRRALRRARDHPKAKRRQQRP